MFVSLLGFAVIIGYCYGMHAEIATAQRALSVPNAPFRYVGEYDLRAGHTDTFDWTLADPNFPAFVHVVAKNGIVREYHSP